jgi:hypothetical protein
MPLRTQSPYAKGDMSDMFIFVQYGDVNIQIKEELKVDEKDNL